MTTHAIIRCRIHVTVGLELEYDKNDEVSEKFDAVDDENAIIDEDIAIIDKCGGNYVNDDKNVVKMENSMRKLMLIL